VTPTGVPIRSAAPSTLLRLCAAVLLAATLAGCDTTVQPLNPQGQYFSLFGTLNAARDTQFVRVEPLDDSIQVGTLSRIDASVTLTHLGTGQSVALEDSARRFEIAGPLGEDEVLVQNFWTSMPIEPGARYRLTARRSDGRKSWATATMPDAAPEVETIRPLLCGENTYVPATVRVATDYLIEATAVYPLPSGRERVDYTEAATRRDEGYRLRISAPCVRSDAFELIAYAGGPSWPRVPNIGDLASGTVTGLDTLSNVRQGVGFFGGTISTRVEIPIRRVNP
jgi:hypothetical protein